MEHSFAEIDRSKQQTKHYVVKGLDESFNYLVNRVGFYDFQYSFPLTIMRDVYFNNDTLVK
jgi:hypothetical protein